MTSRPRIAIIGAGLAGITAARRLADKADVIIFEKSRGLGGRMSTRRAEPFHFDHGAQYFEVKSAAFREYLAPLKTAGVVAEWSPRLVRVTADGTVTKHTPDTAMHVAVPAMNSLCKHLGEGLYIERAQRVSSLSEKAGRWTLSFEDGSVQEGFDWVLCTAPAEQSRVLMPGVFEQSADLHSAQTAGCFTLMLGFGGALTLPWDAARIEGDVLGWVALDTSKPGRSGPPCLTVQSTNAWAEAHMEDDLKTTERAMRAALPDLLPDLPAPEYASLHRWRFAAVQTSAGAPYLLDASNRLAAAGDWCGRARVEAAFESGTAVADAIAGAL